MRFGPIGSVTVFALFFCWLSIFFENKVEPCSEHIGLPLFTERPLFPERPCLMLVFHRMNGKKGRYMYFN